MTRTTEMKAHDWPAERKQWDEIAETQPTPGTWEAAADSYGKVRHSRKACVYSSQGEGTHRLVTIAQKIANWNDARLLAAAPRLLHALVGMNHVTEGGYCICPRNDGMEPDELHATSCVDARRAIAAATGRGR